MEKPKGFRESITEVVNPFDTPGDGQSLGLSTRPQSIHSAISSHRLSQLGGRQRKQRKFKSSRLVGEYEKPWLEKRNPRMLWDKLFFIGFTILGLCIGAYIVYTGWISVDNPDYCLIFEDDFSSGISKDSWTYEIETGGFGAQSFDWTTDDKKNAYTDAEGLHIVPTITTEVTDITEEQLVNGYTLNLTQSGICSSAEASDCVAVSNSTTGTIINPVRSARLVTRGNHNIRYGKVEVVAKLPKGDWLWPAIWMMPEDSVYGEWPASGEIDIMESRGNPRSYDGGRSVVGGTLHWGPESALDAFWRTGGVRYLQRGDYSQRFHTYGVEWSENYIYTYVDSRLAQSMYVPFGKRYGNMFDRGHFSGMEVNGSVPQNPWSNSQSANAPFDQSFYLILNVAVGASSGYFGDGYGNKPWVDGSDTAMSQFWSARGAWLPTWGEGDTKGMTVQSVKMWSRGLCGSS
ncbi:putative gram-negative bacteria binding protein [Xylariaceae sp. FL0016]|nr:putative gram-negative bacteria binding protein [Xylariaceae sp. FL0016]